MDDEVFEDYDRELELALYREYRDVVSQFQYVIETERRFLYQLLRDGKIKAYGVMSKARWFAAPNVPIMDEVGVPGLHIPWWQGLWAPKGTRSDIIAKLNGALVKALIDPKVSRLFSELGLEIPSDEQRTPRIVPAGVSIFRPFTCVLTSANASSRSSPT